MNQPVIAIGLDAADFKLTERWMAAGHLPHLQAIQERGCFGLLESHAYYADETIWTSFLTGCHPEKTGYWSPLQLQPRTYDVAEAGAYAFEDHPAFYALAPARAMTVFDVPHCSTLFDPVNGAQVLAWGSKDPMGPPQSQPSSLIAEITERYGAHPALDDKNRVAWWDSAFMQRLSGLLERGITRRLEILKHLTARGPFDLLLTVFSEIHVAQHQFWHLSESSHPLHDGQAWPDRNPLLSVYQAVDRAIGKLLQRFPAETPVWIFSLNSGGDNLIDLSSQLFLPEYLYRYSFSGKALFDRRGAFDGSEAPIQKLHANDWLCDIWRMRRGPVLPPAALARRWPLDIHPHLYRFLDAVTLSRWRFPYARLGPLGWQPVSWYRYYWPAMQAFALPSYGDGYIRINVRGREPRGTVLPEHFDAVCKDLTAMLRRLVNARTQAPVAKQIIRIREQALDDDRSLPDADLVVIWEDDPADCLQHPDLGRVGPVPYRNTGGHRSDGFFLARGQNTAPGTEIRGGHVVDLAPTLLHALGVDYPDYFDGRPLCGAD